MSQPILPTVADIRTWIPELCLIERTHLRNELAFVKGDQAHGGPKREAFEAQIKVLLEAIEVRLKERLN